MGTYTLHHLKMMYPSWDLNDQSGVRKRMSRNIIFPASTEKDREPTLKKKILFSLRMYSS